MTKVRCLECLLISERSDPRAKSWDCACGFSYVLRRCSECRIVSEVSSLQRNGQPWDCRWCHSPNTGYAARNDPAAATLGDLGADMAKHGLVFTPPKVIQEPADIEPKLIVTMNEIPGYRITQVHGDVFGLTVRNRDYFSSFGSSLLASLGGEEIAYTKLLTDSRNQARARMWHEALARGANAVVAMRFDCNEFGNRLSEVAVYGTAVTAEPIQGGPS